MPLLGYLLNSKIAFILKIPRHEEMKKLDCYLLLVFLQFSVNTTWRLYPLRLKCASYLLIADKKYFMTITWT